MAIYNSCSNAFKIVDVPSNVTAIALHYGPFDLRDLPAAANVKYFLAECVDLNVGVDGVCKRFPGLEMLTLDVHRQQGILQVLDSLKSWKGLKWLGIRHNGSSPGDLVRTLMSEFPCLEGLNVYGSCDVGDVTKGKSGNGKRRTIYLSQCLETNTTDVVELPDLGECASVEIRMSSPKVRPVEIRLQANAKKLHMVDISSSNVIPSGEMNLIDNGFIMYDIRVRLGETESVSSHR